MVTVSLPGAAGQDSFMDTASSHCSQFCSTGEQAEGGGQSWTPSRAVWPRAWAYPHFGVFIHSATFPALDTFPVTDGGSVAWS